MQNFSSALPSRSASTSAPTHPPASSSSAASTSVESHLQRAIELARENLATGAGGPFGAVLAQGDRVVAVGNNQVLSSGDPTAHAEVVAIRRAAAALGHHHLRGLTLYTSCEPCPMCLGAAYWAQVDRIFYALSREDAAHMGFSDDFIYREIAQPGAARRIPCVHHAVASGPTLVTDWLAHPGRQLY